MVETNEPPYGAHLRAIQSAIAALAVAVLAVPLIQLGEYYGFFLFLAALVLVIYSFVPTLLR